MNSGWARTCSLALLVACGEAPPEPGLWGHDKIFVEELRFGAGSGPEEFMFGEVRQMAIGPAGEVVVYDVSSNRVHRFDRDGRYTGPIGATGQGPGEFEILWGLDVDHDGRILLAMTTDEVVVFGPEGRFVDQWRVPGRLLSRPPLTVNHDGSVTLGMLLVTGATPTRQEVAFVRLDEDATPVDTLRPSPTPWEGDIGPGPPATAFRRIQRWSPHGFSVLAVTSQVALQMEWPGGRIVRAERETDPVPYLRAERLEWESYLEFLRGRSGQPERFPDPPDRKPPVRDIVASRSGEVWVQRATPASGPQPGRSETVAGFPAPPLWVEPTLFDVFDPEGRYLGSVHGEPGITVHAIRGDTAWAVTRGPLGVEHVTRLVAVPCGDRC